MTILIAIAQGFSSTPHQKRLLFYMTLKGKNVKEKALDVLLNLLNSLQKATAAKFKEFCKEKPRVHASNL